ncbi:hypothetical protein [Agrococcus carbonis]|uniref:Uncharacterized protein n=1 Tax=Agrococcus carbonis TaxID=684552 RepID=A0A1H1QE23_9MICO|nr:hypothetical protein [Agrococcus carbonis]SDS21700.1 hypothetical protein SAMN04489719_1813 [Agrococcus carbonis]
MGIAFDFVTIGILAVGAIVVVGIVVAVVRAVSRGGAGVGTSEHDLTNPMHPHNLHHGQHMRHHEQAHQQHLRDQQLHQHLRDGQPPAPPAH